jgi:hypothetical protein
MSFEHFQVDHPNDFFQFSSSWHIMHIYTADVRVRPHQFEDQVAHCRRSPVMSSQDLNFLRTKRSHKFNIK